ncbi:MAG: thioredoxin family protein [Chitinophagaceae bacterium]|nr:thioredoxin family protein [Chitinophagaceae bacterium]
MKKVDLSTVVQTYPSYEAYLDAEFRAKIADMKSSESELNEEKKTLLNTITGNYKVIQHLLESYTPSAEMVSAAQAIKTPLDVFIITENWCGSSTFNLPYIVKILTTNPKFNVKVALRDSNPDFMNLYLSPTGGKSLPKVIGINAIAEEVINWGSGSKSEAAKRKELLAQGDKRPVFLQKLMAWFNVNNLKAIEDDFKEVFAVANEK